MRILMMTNTYAPVIGGIEQSIHSFSNQLRKMGHQVVIVAPTFDGMNEQEDDIIRIPAIQNFLKDDVSLTLPIPLFLSHLIREFQPDIIHSHHFFWVGDMAMRLARQNHVPLVFTHHIMLDQYADFLPVHNERIKRFVLKLATGYANLTDAVIAPSQAVYDILRQEGVHKPIHILPTGVDVEHFAFGNRLGYRHQLGIPEDALVMGCVCRMNPEKNLEFLARAASRFLAENHKAHCLLVGSGSMREGIEQIFDKAGVKKRLHCPGVLQGRDLVDAYHAMDLFIFSSKSETQGIVLTEAMACAKPVIALDAPAVREIVKDHKNGRLIKSDSEDQFVSALSWFAHLHKSECQKLKQSALATSAELSTERCTERLLSIYEDLKLSHVLVLGENNLWDSFKDSLKTEKDLLQNAIEATEAALRKSDYE